MTAPLGSDPVVARINRAAATLRPYLERAGETIGITARAVELAVLADADPARLSPVVTIRGDHAGYATTHQVSVQLVEDQAACSRMPDLADHLAHQLAADLERLEHPVVTIAAPDPFTEAQRLAADFEATQAAVMRTVTSVGNFAADMRAAGIHVGLGSPPTCCTCDQPYPCTSARGGSR